jgi:hypothetical protein
MLLRRFLRCGVSGDLPGTAHQLSPRIRSKFLRICHISNAEELTSFSHRDPRISQAHIIFALVGIVCLLCQRCAPGGRFPCSLTFRSHLVCPTSMPIRFPWRRVVVTTLRRVSGLLLRFFLGCARASVFGWGLGSLRSVEYRAAAATAGMRFYRSVPLGPLPRNRQLS